MSKQPPPVPTVSAVGPCRTVIQIVGRPGTGSLPSTIAPPDHPSAFKVTFSPQFLELYEHKPYAKKTFNLRISPLLESSNINPNNIEKHFVTDIPPWCIIFKSSSHVTQSINISILMVPKMERKLGVL